MEILEEFYTVRLAYYKKRKRHLLRVIQSERYKLKNRLKFVEAVLNGDIQFKGKRKQQLVAELKARGFQTMSEIDKETPISH